MEDVGGAIDMAVQPNVIIAEKPSKLNNSHVYRATLALLLAIVILPQRSSNWFTVLLVASCKE